MSWLDRVGGGTGDVVSYKLLSTFVFEGEQIPLIDRQRGIRRVRSLSGAFSIRTTYTPPSRVAPYDDVEGVDGLLRYKYQGTNPDSPDNVALRKAFELQLPLIWFVGIKSGLYQPVYPIWIVADEPQNLQVVVALDESQRLLQLGNVSEEQRRYAESVTKVRLHQRIFRAKVLVAYKERCAMCGLLYRPLLDAAHILPDSHPQGKPIVTNGLSLCKIHHAAYDLNYIGVRPDLVAVVRSDVMNTKDGPMLTYGLQAMNERQLIVPAKKSEIPDRNALEERFEEFKDIEKMSTSKDE